MGFSNFIKEYDYPSIYQTLKKANEHIKEIIKQQTILPNVKVTFFSDNILISTKCPQAKSTKKWDDCKSSIVGQFMNLINFIQLKSILFGYEIFQMPTLPPLRGAISCGDFIHDNENDVYFGKPLIDTVKMELDSAYYPRIIYDEEILSPETIQRQNQLDNINKSYLCKDDSRIAKLIDIKKNTRRLYFRRDFDGMLHGNYLNSIRMDMNDDSTWTKNNLYMIDCHKRYIEKNLNRFSDYKKYMKIIQKYRWMASYHNWYCDGFNELKQYRIDERVYIIN